MGVGGVRPGGPAAGAAAAAEATESQPAKPAAPPEEPKPAPAAAEPGGRNGISGQFSAAALLARVEGGLSPEEQAAAKVSKLEGRIGDLDRKVGDADKAAKQAGAEKTANEAAARKPTKELAKDYDAANGPREAEVKAAKAAAEQRLGVLENRLLAVNGRLKAMDEEPGGSSPARVEEYVKTDGERKGLEKEIEAARAATTEARKLEAALPKTPEQKAKLQKAEYESRAGKAGETAKAAGATKSGAEAERTQAKKDLAGAKDEQASLEKARKDMQAADDKWNKDQARRMEKADAARKTEAENKKLGQKEFADLVKLGKELGVVKFQRKEIPGIPIYDSLHPILQGLIEEGIKTPIPLDAVKGVGEAYNLVGAFLDPRTSEGEKRLLRQLTARGMDENQAWSTIEKLQQLVRGELQPPE